MAGFIVSNLRDKSIDLECLNIDNKKLYFKDISNEEFIIKRSSLNSFRNDKLMYEGKKKIIITEGVIINSNELLAKYCAKDMLELIDIMSDKRENFFKELKGSFSGAIYFKAKKKWIFFTDQLGSHSIYYWSENRIGGKYVIASQLNYLKELLRNNEITVEEDLHGIHCFLDWGYLIDNATELKNVKRLYPGEYLVLNEGIINTKTYYIANYEPENKTIDEYIEELDSAFSNAVKRIVNKSIENGYKNILDISGGLDSRLIAYKAIELFGSKQFIGFHFSQSNSIEENVAFDVAKKLGLEMFYIPMDMSNFLCDIKEIMTLNNGSSYYLGMQVGLLFGRLIDNRVYGIEITGLLGDVRDSAMILEKGDEKPELKDAFYKSNTLNNLNKYSEYSTVIDRFKYNEVFWLYLRGISAGMNTVLAKQNYVEVMTPYGDIEFLEAYLSIPWSLRCEKKILLEWMKKKFPLAAEITYAQTNLPAKYTWTWRHINYDRIRRRLKFLLPKKTMLNVEKWFMRDDILNVISEYYNKNIIKVKNNDIRNKIKNLYYNGNSIEKSIALSVLAIYDIYID